MKTCCSQCQKTFFVEILDFPEIKKFKMFVLMPEPA